MGPSRDVPGSFSVLWEVSRDVVWNGGVKACPSPCNRGCAPYECTVKLLKSCCIDGSPLDHYLGVRTWVGDKSDFTAYEMSLGNVVRSISLNEVLIVEIANLRNVSMKTLKALSECVKTLPSPKSLTLKIDCHSLFFTDVHSNYVRDIFSIVVANNVSQNFKIRLMNSSPLIATIVRILVDALLQNEGLRETTFELAPVYQDAWNVAPDIMGELRRYSKSPNNALTEFSCDGLSDNQVERLSYMLCDLKKLKKVTLIRVSNKLSAEMPGSLRSETGVGMIGEALSGNIGLETLTIANTEIGVQEIEKLVRALIPDDTSRRQRNTSLLHLSFVDCSVKPGEEREWMQNLATLLRSNTSILTLDLIGLTIFGSECQGASQNVEILFASLKLNASLKALDLTRCGGIGGKHVVGMIMDMLLHNHTLRKIGLMSTGLEDGRDRGVELVYAELRERSRKKDENHDQGVVKLERMLEHVPPNSARIFLCGNQAAGKTTICKRWRDISNSTLKGKISMPFSSLFKRTSRDKFPMPRIDNERTRGIEVHKMVWGTMDINVWDMAGQSQYHSFHDLVLPNQSAIGGCTFYCIVCDPRKDKNIIVEEVSYWLMFVASNTRKTESYHPHVTILMTHHDMWRNDHQIRQRMLEDIVNKLKEKFQHVLDFDKDVTFFAMDNESPPYNDAKTVMQNVEENMRLMSQKLPKVLKASIELQAILVTWNIEHPDKCIVNWDEFSKGPCEEVKGLRTLETRDKEVLEKTKKLIATSLHNGGYIMYFEELGMVITNPHWFWHDIMGAIFHQCSSLNPNLHMIQNGIISRDDLKTACRDLRSSEPRSQKKKHMRQLDVLIPYLEERFDEILEMMMKLQICYKDVNDDNKVMIPAILGDEPSNLRWRMDSDSNSPYNYVGTRLASNDETITSLTAGFFPRFQVYLHNKYPTPTYKIYLNFISFIYEDIDIFITTSKGSINILSRSSRARMQVSHDVHKMIKDDIYDLRAICSLGCPGVVFQEHIIRPRCVEHCLSQKDAIFQTVPKQLLRDLVLLCGNFNYIHHWGCVEGCVEGFSHINDLFGVEEWKNILELREGVLKEVEKELDSQLTSKIGREYRMPTGDLNEDNIESFDTKLLYTKMVSVSKKVDFLATKVDLYHSEVMELLKKIESNIISLQHTLIARVCSNIDRLMDFTLQLHNSGVPKLPYFGSSISKGLKPLLMKMVPDLTSCQLHFMCEHDDGFHIVKNQPGCEIHFGTEKTKMFVQAMNMGLSLLTILLKVGAHLGGGMGPMVPDLAQKGMLILDTPGLLDLIQLRDGVLKLLPSRTSGDDAMMSVKEREDVTKWLVECLKVERRGKSIYDMFKLTKRANTKRSGVAWVCDDHKGDGRYGS